jgi:hypothetical protein
LHGSSDLKTPTSKEREQLCKEGTVDIPSQVGQSHPADSKAPSEFAGSLNQYLCLTKLPATNGINLIHENAVPQQDKCNKTSAKLQLPS